MQRPSDVARLAALLHQDERGLKIAAITGPGGVGKSYLISEVLSRNNPRDLEFMHLSADAADLEARGDFFRLVDGQLATRALPPPARPDRDYFPQLRAVAATYRRVVEEASVELARAGAPNELKAAVLALLRAAHLLNKSVSKSREIVDVARLNLNDEKVEAMLDAAWDAAAKLGSLAASTAWLPGPLKDLLGYTAEDRVKHDLFSYAADAIYGDLRAALTGYQSSDLFKLTHPPLEGFKRLLIVLDDFEATAPVLGDFLVAALIRRLADAPFSTVMIIGSRDDLEALHPGFGQHAKQWIVQDIHLSAFDRATAFDLMTQAGIPSARQESLFDATHGLPYLLSLMIEEATTGEPDSALFARKFFVRTTRWMTERQREWFRLVCYLDVVNEDTIEAMFNGAANPTEVQNWFESESSIRDPSSPVFAVRPLIRQKCVQYFATRSPNKHREMMNRAGKINGVPIVSV